MGKSLPVEDTNELLRKLVEMLTPKATPTTRVPELVGLDKLAQLLTEKVATRKPTLPMQTEPIKLETRLQDFLEGRQRVDQEFRQRPVQRDWAEMKCFSCGKSGPQRDPLPNVRYNFSVHITRMEGREVIVWLYDGVAKEGVGTTTYGKRKLIRGGGGGPSLGSAM